MRKKQMNTASGHSRLAMHGPYFVMLAPFLILFIIFTILPIISSIVLSFTSYDMLSVPEFTGIDNYRRMFLDDDVFPIVLKNTLVFAILSGPAGFLLSFSGMVCQ